MIESVFFKTSSVLKVFCSGWLSSESGLVSDLYMKPVRTHFVSP